MNTIKKKKTWMENESRRTNKKPATTSETAKECKTESDQTERKDPQNTTADKYDNTTGRNKSKDIGKRRKTPKIPRRSANKYKQIRTF